jgi:hypothetical protein
VTNRFDYNRDGTVSVIDQLLSRNNQTTVATKLQQITVPAVLQASGLKAQALADQQPVAPAPSGVTSIAREGEAPAESRRGAVVASTSASSLLPQALAAAYAAPSVGSATVDADLPTTNPATVDDDLLELLSSGK